MKLRGKIEIVATLLMALVLSAGCQRRPLDEASDGLSLNLPLNVEVKDLEKGIAEAELMRVLLYGAESLEFVSDGYVLPDGGYINALPGKYKMVVYNFDTERTRIRGDRGVVELEAYTNDIPNATRTNLLTKLRASTKADFVAPSSTERIVYEPDHFLVAREDVEILHRTGTQELHATASSIVESYYLGVSLQNSKYIASAQALLSGQAESNKFGFEGGMSKNSVILYFDMKAGVNEKYGTEVLQTTFNTFGKLPNEESRLWLTIVVTTTTGEIITWQDDITDKFVDNKDKYIYLEEDPNNPIVVPVPPPSSEGGGFQPEVDEWDTIYEDIII